MLSYKFYFSVTGLTPLSIFTSTLSRVTAHPLFQSTNAISHVFPLR